ncbi:MAG TPA: helix-turn-helix domain-containing protein [bacterium]|nr:helix-turn-helix domain-containing protein [bacterium]
MQETRLRIIEMLRIRGGQTVQDLARGLRLTRTAVTSHLAVLQTRGLVARSGLRPGSRRPSVVYVATPATEAVFPKSYEEFAGSVLAELEREGTGRLDAVLRRIGDRWIARDLPRLEGLTGRTRMERVMEILTERGFLPRLERSRGGTRLYEHNCPVMRLAAAHPQVCDTVHRWLEALFGRSMQREQCLRKGDPYSVYTIRSAS